MDKKNPKRVEGRRKIKDKRSEPLPRWSQEENSEDRKWTRAKKSNAGSGKKIWSK